MRCQQKHLRSLLFLTFSNLCCSAANVAAQRQASPLNCLSQTTLYDVFMCVRNFIIPRGEIQNLARFQQLYPPQSTVDDWKAVIRAMLDTGKCPTMLPPSIDEQMACVVWRNRSVILMEKVVSNCRAISSSGQCTNTSSISYFDKGWGFFAVPLHGRPVVNLHLSAAHPISDGVVGLQAAYVFENANARSVMVSGVRRDAFLNKSAGDCQTHNYPADGAHNIRTLFHQTLLVTREWQLQQPWSCPHDSCVFLQLHGMRPSSCGSDTVFLSAGLGSDAASLQFINNTNVPVRRLQASLRERRPEWTVNTPAESSCSLVARTNVFGRVLNGVSIGNECSRYASTSEATGLFLHAEQKSSSRAAKVSWTDAIKNAFS